MIKNVIISIKPIYVKRILRGTKKFEYRKGIFKQDVNNIYIYESYPTKKIVAYFKYTGFLSDSPKKIWNLTKNISGVDEDFFFKYFQGKECAYAIKIRDLKVLTKSIDPKKVIEDFTPPQSYKYIEREIVIDEKFCRMVQG